MNERPPGLSDKGSAAFGFLATPTMLNALASDQWRRHKPAQEIRLAISPSWPEVDRATRAISYIDREIRRCAQAWQQAYEHSSETGDESVFASPRLFHQFFNEYPTPAPVGLGSLRTSAAPGDAITFDSMTPHRLSNPFEESCQAVWFVVARRSDDRSTDVVEPSASVTHLPSIHP